MTGNLFIVCAPSGAGKTSLVSELLKVDSLVRLSVSYTTRKPRLGETDGREYHFVKRKKFESMLEQGMFLESALVHGNHYGTSHEWITQQRIQGNDILLEIDWQGAAQVRELMPDAVGIFILPPAFETLVSRLNMRAQDPPDVIALRLAAASEEISHVSEFNYVIINDNFEVAAQDLISIVRAERLRLAAQTARHNDLINRMK